MTPLAIDLDALPHGQEIDDYAGTTWQRVNFPAEKPFHVPAQWQSRDGYGTWNSVHLLASYGFSRLGPVTEVVTVPPPIERGPAIEVSQA